MMDLEVDVDGAVPFAPQEEQFEINETDSDDGSDDVAQEGAEATVRPVDALPLGRQFMLASVVIFLLLYPTLITRCLQMVRCETIDYGPPSPAYPPGGTRSLLFADRSIDCNTPTHAQYTNAALTAGLSYGIGIPLTISLVIISLMRTRGVEEALSTFAFYTAGYDSRFWWWEGVILTRKLALISISVFVQQDGLRLYIAMWFLSAALIGHIQAHPFVNQLLHNMETLSLATIVITLNLALLFPFTESNPVLFFALAIVVVSLNVFAIGSILAFMMRELAVMFANTIAKYSHKLRALWEGIFFVRWYLEWKRKKEREQQAARDDDDDADRPQTAVLSIMPQAGEIERRKKHKKKGLIARLMAALEGKGSLSGGGKKLQPHEAATLQAHVLLHGRAAAMEIDLEAGEGGGEKSLAEEKKNDTDAKDVLSHTRIWQPPDADQAWKLVVDKDDKLLELLHDDVMQLLHVDLLDVVALEQQLTQEQHRCDALIREMELKRQRQQYFSARDLRNASVTQGGILRKESSYNEDGNVGGGDGENDGAGKIMDQLARKGTMIVRKESSRLQFHMSSNTGSKQ